MKLSFAGSPATYLLLLSSTLLMVSTVAQNYIDDRQLQNGKIAAMENQNTNKESPGNGNGNGVGNGVGNGNNKYSPYEGDDDDAVNIIIKYKNQNGKSQAGQLGQLGMDLPRFNFASIATTRKNWRAIIANPNIEYAEPDYDMYVVDAIPSSESTFLRGGSSSSGGSVRGNGKQEHRKLVEETPYGITNVQARDLPDIPEENEGKITVCVVDTGYGGNSHDDLPTLSEGFSTISGETWDYDGHGHGTHVAGTIFAIGGNDIGVDSVLSDPSKFGFYIGKVFNATGGGGTTSKVMNAVNKCYENGANVINLSLGGGASTSFLTLTKTLFDDGVLMVAAAGNDGDNTLNYPASYPHVMSVAAVDSENNWASFSQYNNQVEIAAPGVGVKSTLPTNTYATWYGTSMATPHVAGVAALVWAHFPSCSNLQIRNVLLRSAVGQENTRRCDRYYGYGVVNAKAAYDLLVAEGCAAGGNDPETLSDGSKGGCSQEVPTPCAGSNTFTVKLTTDNYPQETGFDVIDSSGNRWIYETDYTDADAFTTYTEIFCLPNGDYTFTIYDSYGDGICCSYGNGSYQLLVDGVEIHSGSSFRASESFDFTIEDPPPTSIPSSIPSNTPSSSPSSVPTSTHSSSPSLRPSNGPSSNPSSRPSSTPSNSPSSLPSNSPSSLPSSGPSSTPSSSPTTPSPSQVPSSTPSQVPSSAPSRSPSSAPSSNPTAEDCGDFPCDNNIHSELVIVCGATPERSGPPNETETSNPTRTQCIAKPAVNAFLRMNEINKCGPCSSDP